MKIARALLIATACLLSPAALTAQNAARDASAAGARPPVPSRDVTILLAGDLLGPYGASFDPEDPRLAALTRIVRGADAAFANQEGSSFDQATNAIAAAAENGGGYPIHSLAAMRAYKAMGFDLLSRANNHATDWGTDGMLASDHALDAIGFTHAGTGASLVDARKAAVFAAPRGARIALVATASTFPGMAPAGEAIRGGAPRPGLNPLHVTPVTNVTPEEFGKLASIAQRGGWQGRDLPTADSRELYIGEGRFRISERPGLSYEVAAADRAAILGEVKAAKAHADAVIFSIHAHETGSGGYEDPMPADFLPPLFHAVIDDGADVVVRHGPHAVQGIEIYKGRPIFYGLGHFFFDLPRQLDVATPGGGVAQTVTFPDTWWMGSVATVTLRDGALRELRVYPLRIDGAEGRERGYPELATGALARTILETIQARSRAFGTRMKIVGNVGIVTS